MHSSTPRASILRVWSDWNTIGFYGVIFVLSKINIYNLSYDEESKDSVDLTYTIKDFKLPLEINNDIVDILLKTKKTDGPPTFMYM